MVKKYIQFKKPDKSINAYGVEWDGSETTKWKRTDLSAKFPDPVPAIANGTGSSPFDNIMPWSGMIKVEHKSIGTMVKIPKFWYKLSYASGTTGLKIQIANKATSGFSVSPAHVDRGDGAGERDVVYVGRYHCSNDYKSRCANPAYRMTRSAARSNIHTMNGANVWQWDFAMLFTIWLLYLVEFADWNCKEKIGYGYGTSNNDVDYMCYTNGMKYHTGTSQPDRTSYGLGTQYRNIEGLWNNCYDWVDGCYYGTGGLNIILNPNNFSDNSGGIPIGYPSNGFASAFTIKNIEGTFPMFIPIAAEGNNSTYSCDTWKLTNPCLVTGGSYKRVLGDGLFHLGSEYYNSNNTSIGSRIMELP